MSRTAFALAAVMSIAMAVPAAAGPRPWRRAGSGRWGHRPVEAVPAGPGYPKFFDSNMPFQPRDLAGIWTPNGNGFGGRRAMPRLLEERYARINYDTIELKMTLTDPKYYAKPWTSETKRMHLLTEDIRPVVGMDRAARGWWHSCPAFGIVVTDRSGNDEKPIILEDRVERAGLVRDPAAGTAGRGPRRRLLAGRMANAARGRAAHLRIRDSRCQGQRRVLPELFRCHDHWLH